MQLKSSKTYQLASQTKYRFQLQHGRESSLLLRREGCTETETVWQECAKIRALAASQRVPAEAQVLPYLLPPVEADTAEAARTIASIEATAVPEPNSEAQAENAPMESPDAADVLTEMMMQQ